MKKVVLILVAIVVMVGLYELARHHSAHSGKGGPPGTVGTVAPAFSMQDVDGKPLNSASYQGKVVLLDFWATWCVPCRSEIPHFVEFQNNYAAQGFQVVGISMDDGPEPVRKFYQDFKMNYPVGMGTTELAQSYGGILGLPVTFLIDREGHSAAKYVGLTDTATIQQKVESLLAKK
jgi:cytochrome c biogenesis protein CcmG, thiol:disulfide interchange protein DsbE